MNRNESGNINFNEERTFDKLVGIINKIKITIGVFIDTIDNYSSKRYSGHNVLEEYKFNDNIKILQIECFVDKDYVLDYYIINE
jgi:hypothetical protein